MEASVAAAGESTGTEAAEGAEAAEAAAGLDPGEVMSRFDAMQQGMEAMRAELTQRQAAPEAEAEPEDDFSWLNPDDDGSLDPEAMQHAMREQTARAAQEAARPALEAVAEMQRAQEAQALRSEFPEIGQPETANAIIAGATEYAGAVMQSIAPTLKAAGLPDQMIEAIGQGIVSSPATWRNVYLGTKGLSAAQAETPVHEGAGLLEGGSGPRPGAQEQMDPAQQIVAAQGGSILPF